MKKGFPDNFFVGAALLPLPRRTAPMMRAERGLIPRIYDILTRRGQRKSGLCFKTVV